MEKIMQWFSARENVTFLIAIVGFLLSLWNFFKDLWKNRCSFSVEYISHYCGKHPSGSIALQLRLNFENKSSAPVYVTRMFLDYRSERCEFVFPPQCVWEFRTTRKSQIIREERIMSQELPFKIEGYGALGGYFIVFLPNEFEEHFRQKVEIQMTIQTTRKKKNVLLVADNPGRDVEQYGKK